MAVVLEEADETGFWLELLAEAETVRPERLRDLRNEPDQLIRTFSAAWHTTQTQIRNRKSGIRNL